MDEVIDVCLVLSDEIDTPKTGNVSYASHLNWLDLPRVAV